SHDILLTCCGATLVTSVLLHLRGDIRLLAAMSEGDARKKLHGFSCGAFSVLPGVEELVALLPKLLADDGLDLRENPFVFGFKFHVLLAAETFAVVGCCPASCRVVRDGGLGGRGRRVGES